MGRVSLAAVMMAVAVCDAARPLVRTLGPASATASPLVSRRRACAAAGAAVGLALVGSGTATAAEPTLTASQLLTVGQYLVDLREARGGLTLVAPLFDKQEEESYEAVRIALRKPPVSGIRKAASKVINELADGELKKSKESQYKAIKDSLGALDDACRPGVDRSKFGYKAEVERLEGLLDAFSRDLGVSPDPI